MHKSTTPNQSDDQIDVERLSYPIADRNIPQSDYRLTYHQHLHTLLRGTEVNQTNPASIAYSNNNLISVHFLTGSVKTNHQFERFKKSLLGKLLGISILLMSILGGSSIGSLANFVPIQSPFAKNSWRSGILFLYLIIPGLVEGYLKRKSYNYRDVFSFKAYLLMFCAFILQVLWTFGLFYASINTIQAHAYIFNNLHGIFMVILYLIIGVPTHFLQKFGAFIALVGVVVMVLDPNAKRVNGEPAGSFVIDLLTILSSIPGALYFMLSSRIVNRFPVFMYLAIMSLHTFILNAVLAMAMDPTIVFLSMDPKYGCFGFLARENALFCLIPYGILCGFFGSAGYILTLLFYSPLVTTSAIIAEPLVAQLMGCMFGFDLFPGWMTILGGVVAIAGVLAIDRGAHRLSEVQRKEALLDVTAISHMELKGISEYSS